MESKPGDLQFDRAEYGTSEGAAPTCVSCKRRLEQSYYEWGGRMVCELCRVKIQQSLTGGSGVMRFVRASVAGCAAAALGAGLYFGIAALTGYEFGLVAIIVGLMVGKAVQWGSARRGGWRYQVLAMFLTYAAIVTTYIPSILASMSEEETQSAQAPAGTEPVREPGAQSQPASVTEQTSPVDSDQAAQDMGEEPLTLTQFLLGWGVLFAIAFAAPFLQGIQNIMGIIIIGIGLYEAWKINQRLKVEFAGPFSIARGTGGTQPAASS